jgi:hypothetical protein
MHIEHAVLDLRRELSRMLLAASSVGDLAHPARGYGDCNQDPDMCRIAAFFAWPEPDTTGAHGDRDPGGSR